MPLISVVIPAYNRAHLLPRVLNSVQAQTFTDFEVVVVDDGSTDDTRAVVEGVGDERIRYVYQENAGAGAARNHGVREAQGNHVAFLDSDDEAHANWLHALADTFRNQEADVVCCGHEVMADGQHQRTALPRAYGPAFNSVTGLFYGSFAMRKAVFEAIGGYAEDLPAGQHTDLALRLAWHPQAEQWTIHNIMTPLLTVYKHEGARIRGDRHARYAASRHLFEVHRDKLRKDSDVLADYSGSAGVNAFRLGEYEQARRFLWMSARADPANPIRWARVVLALVKPLGKRVWT